MDSTYWRRQSSTKPLFPEIEWNRPEQKTRAGKLAIIGGNKMGFIAVATAYDEATKAGAGQVRVILPDALKKSVPPSVLDAVYVSTNPSGGMSKEATSTVEASFVWADHVLLIGDGGRNSETAIVYENLLKLPTPLTITRDAVDLLKNSAMQMVDRDKTTLVVSFAQLQKLFQAVYYPKILSFSMQLMSLVEILHKFTITYPCTIVTFHQNQLIVAYGGDVVTAEFDQPMMIWRGSTATKAACYQLWTPGKPLEAITASIAS
ncbi:hypothetical protein H7Y40_02705 [Pedobacter sp.]|nr:hypothetical protein [Candidatus Saccharibacteria bacterium]